MPTDIVSLDDNPEMRAVRLVARVWPVQVVDRLADGLWIAFDCDPAPVVQAFTDCQAVVKVGASDSLFVPFRDSIRGHFRWFARVVGGPVSLTRCGDSACACRKGDPCPLEDSG